jgi:predicted membrane protein
MAHRSTQESLGWGIILISVGVIFLLNNSGTITIGELISDYWPVLIILVGLSIILKSKRSDVHTPASMEKNIPPLVSDHVIQSNTFGNIFLNLKNHDFKSGQIRTVFGDIHVDANKIIPGGEQTLHMDTVFGNIKFTAPTELPIKVIANNLVGTIRIFEQKWDGLSHQVTHESEKFPRAKNRLILVCSTTFGDIKIW